MIPKIIHYCWFGNGGEKPVDVQNYISGWKKVLPDYDFIEWNESNFDVNSAPTYVREAYECKKYAFVSDYARIKALSEHGGVYFDTDIEVLRRFDDLLENRDMVLGFESDQSLETAFIACCKNHPFIIEFLNTYNGRKFIQEDGSYDMSVINEHFSRLAKQWGVDFDNEGFQELQDGKIAIYPRDYFAAFDIGNWHVKVTDNTYTVHHMNASWGNKSLKLYFRVIYMLQKILGYDGYDKLKAIYDKVKNSMPKKGK